MKTYFLFAVVVVLFSTAHAQNSNAANSIGGCNTSELINGNAGYNKLVCEGIHAMDSGDSKSAIDALEKAENIKFPESPNYKLFPRLADAYFRIGDMNNAHLYLERSRLALSLVVGVMHCEETDSGFYIAQFASSKVDSPQNRDVATSMCGAAYDDIYEGRTLESTLSDSKLIEYYLAVKKKIEP